MISFIKLKLFSIPLLWCLIILLLQSKILLISFWEGIREGVNFLVCDRLKLKEGSFVKFNTD